METTLYHLRPFKGELSERERVWQRNKSVRNQNDLRGLDRVIFLGFDRNHAGLRTEVHAGVLCCPDIRFRGVAGR